MPKANPFTQLSKKLAALHAKSVKISEEIKALAQVADAEMKKLDAAPAPAKAAPAKAPAKAAPKKVVKGKVAKPAAPAKKK